uniref:Uncharacterized protein n=1 Tax=Rhizophora mucronata TaxID=61149 RepID=A0A2P2IHM2_RHIMU
MLAGVDIDINGHMHGKPRLHASPHLRSTLTVIVMINDSSCQGLVFRGIYKLVLNI